MKKSSQPHPSTCMDFELLDRKNGKEWREEMKGGREGGKEGREGRKEGKGGKGEGRERSNNKQ